jgi:hypothetical protein
MKSAPITFVVLAASLLLAGCSSGLLDRKSTVPQAASVPTNGNLALPPDLQLATPGTATRRVAQPVVEDGLYDTASAEAGAAAPPPRSAVGQARQNCPSGAVTTDVYVCYGISKVNSDGTPKSKERLAAELKAAVLAEKRRQNPGYGTVKNIGAIFRDD